MFQKVSQIRTIESFDDERKSLNSSRRAFVRPRAFHWMQEILGMTRFLLFSFVGLAGCSGGCWDVASSSLDL